MNAKLTILRIDQHLKLIAALVYRRRAVPHVRPGKVKDFLSVSKKLPVTETGPWRATIETRRKILHSEMSQRISLTFNSPRLDFDAYIDWHDRHVLLKVAFPGDILSPLATYKILWGNIQ